MAHRPQKAKSVAIIDDDCGMRQSLAVLLGLSGFHIRQYNTAESFVADPHAFDSLGCLLVDQTLTGMSGLDLLRHLDDCSRSRPAILFSARLCPRTIIDARAAGAIAVLEKPVWPVVLIRHLATALTASADEVAMAPLAPTPPPPTDPRGSTPWRQRGFSG